MKRVYPALARPAAKVQSDRGLGLGSYGKKGFHYALGTLSKCCVKITFPTPFFLILGNFYTIVFLVTRAHQRSMPENLIFSTFLYKDGCAAHTLAWALIVVAVVIISMVTIVEFFRGAVEIQ